MYAENSGLIANTEDCKLESRNVAVVAFYTDMRNDGKLLTRSAVTENEDEEE